MTRMTFPIRVMSEPQHRATWAGIWLADDPGHPSQVVTRSHPSRSHPSHHATWVGTRVPASSDLGWESGGGDSDGDTDREATWLADDPDGDGERTEH